MNIERLFSKGHKLLDYTRNRLSSQSTRALLCLGSWLHVGLVKDSDVIKVASLPDVVAEDAEELAKNWDLV